MLSVCVCERDERALHVCRQDVRHSCTCAQFNQSPLFFRLSTFVFSFLFLCSPFSFIQKSWSRKSWACFYFGCLISLLTPSSSSSDMLYSRPHPGGKLCMQAPHWVPVWFSPSANPASDSQRNAASPNFIWSVCKLEANENKWKGHLILEEFKRGKCAFNKRYSFLLSRLCSLKESIKHPRCQMCWCLHRAADAASVTSNPFSDFFDEPNSLDSLQAFNM